MRPRRVRCDVRFAAVAWFSAAGFATLGCGGPSTGIGGSAAEPEIVATELPPAPELPPPQFGPHDWPQWRGPRSNGVSDAQSVPTTWSETSNVLWKSPVPGRGHSSPTIVGDRVVLSTGELRKKTQSVLCWDRETGRLLWERTLHRDGLESNLHAWNSQASPTIASDGERLFAAFLTGGRVIVTALDLDGNELWRTDVAAFVSDFGYGASPVVHGPHVIVAADHQKGGSLAALHRGTGEIRWRKARLAMSSYASPVVFEVGGKPQLLLGGTNRTIACDPLTGASLWETPGPSDSVASTMVADGDLVFASGGYPQNRTLAIHADGSGRIAWTSDVHVYTPSLLAHAGHLYALKDDGVACCWSAATGEIVWRKRVGGNFAASPVLVQGHLFVPSQEGKTVVFRADPQRFELVAENQLGTESFASISTSGDRLFLRVADVSSGERLEFLYCIAPVGAR